MRAAIWAGLRYLRHDRLLARVSLSSLTFGFLFPMLVASFPVLAYQQYDGNPRVAGLLFAVIGGGQVVGSLLTTGSSRRVRPMRLASFAVLATGPPLWLLVPHVPLAVVGAGAGDRAALDPADQRAVHRLLTCACRGAARARCCSRCSRSTRSRAARLRRRRDALRQAGLHGTYVVVAALASFASLNFILAVAPLRGAVDEEAA